MAKNVELDIKLNPKVNKGQYKQQLKHLEGDVSDINIGIHIDEKQADAAIADVMDAWDELEEAMSEAIIADIDTDEGEAALKRLDKAIKDIEGADFNVDKLSQEFKQTKQNIDELATKQKQALAQLKLTGKEGTDAYNKLQKEIEETEQKVREVEDAMGDLADVEEPEQFINVLAKFEALGNLGAAIQGFADQGKEVQKAMKEVQIATQATNEELELIKENAIDAFKNGVGESVADAIKIVGKGKNLLGDFLDDTEINKFIVGAQGIADAYDKDVRDIIAGSRTAIANFELDGQQAIDYVSLIMSDSESKMDDAIDTLDEYSQHAVSAGYSIQEFAGIIQVGMQNGQRDTDRLFDSIKETQIRIQAGDTSAALAGIGAPIARQIQNIVDLGEQGVKSIKDVTKESALLIKEAYDSGEITKATRDQLANALGGTMPEEIGGQLWTKIFSADIDAAAIEQQARRAGALVNENIGPITFVDKVQKELDAFAASAGETLAGTADVIGKSLTSLSQVAPGISLLSSSIGPVKEMASSLVSRLAPGLLAAAKAQGGLNLAMLANPYVAIIAGVAALATGIYFLVDALHTSTEEAIEETKAEDEMLKKQIELNRQKQQAVKNDQGLIESFKNQGEAALENTELMSDLVQTYPKAIDQSKSYEENLAALEAQTKNNNKELENLDTDLSDLASRSVEIDIKIAKLKVDEALEELEDEIAGYDWTTHPLSALFGAHDSDKLDVTAPYIKALKEAKNDQELNKAYVDLQDAIFTSDEFDEKDKLAINEVVDKSIAAIDKKIEAEANKRETFIDRMLAGGAEENKIIEQLAQKFNLTTEEARKLVETQKESNEEADKANEKAEEARKKAEAKRKAEEAATKARERREALVQKELDAKLDELELDKQLADAENEIAIIKRGTSSTAIDEILEQQRVIQLLNDKLDVLNKTRGVTSEQREAIKSQIADIEDQLKLEEKTFEKLTIQSEIHKADLDEQLRQAQADIDKESLTVKLKSSEADRTDVESFYEEQRQFLLQKREQLNQDYLKADEIGQRQVELQLIENNQEIVDLEEDKQKDINTIIEREYNERLKLLQDKNEEEIGILEEIAEFRESVIQGFVDGTISLLDEETDRRLDALDKRKEGDLDYFVGTEEQKLALQKEYEDKKNAIIEEAEKKRQVVQTAMAGSQFAFENSQVIKREELRQEELRLELEAAEKRGDIQAAEKLKEELQKSQDIVKEKGDKLRQGLELVQADMGNIMGNLFSGNIEGMKEGTRKMLAEIAGFIEQEIALWVIKVVLESPQIEAAAAAAGWAAPLVLAGATAAITAGVHALFSPILSAIAAFPTGAIFEQPTLALVGDGNRLGGENREILLRDDQLQKVIDTALEKNNAVMASYFNNLLSALSQQRVVGKLQGSDMLLLMQRAQAEEDRRNVT